MCDKKDVFASACAVARAYPLYTRKSGTNGNGNGNDNTNDKIIVNVEFVVIENETIATENVLTDTDIECLINTMNGIRLAAKIVDMPCNEMNVSHFIDEINSIASELNVKSTIIRGEELNVRGFGGIYGVGKAATVPPALAVLSYEPTGATETYAWIGKGNNNEVGKNVATTHKPHSPAVCMDCTSGTHTHDPLSLVLFVGQHFLLHSFFFPALVFVNGKYCAFVGLVCFGF